MSLTVEDGTGVVSAESYASVAAADTYWGNRTHTAFYTAWNAAATATKEGALREATAFADATWGRSWRGVRRGRVQGLLWPRNNAFDDAQYPLPDLPQELVDAICELAGRAVSARLADDHDRGGAIKRERVGPIEVEYFDGAMPGTAYGYVAGMLAPILDGSQAGATSWHWR